MEFDLPLSEVYPDVNFWSPIENNCGKIDRVPGGGVRKAHYTLIHRCLRMIYLQKQIQIFQQTKLYFFIIFPFFFQKRTFYQSETQKRFKINVLIYLQKQIFFVHKNVFLSKIKCPLNCPIFKIRVFLSTVHIRLYNHCSDFCPLAYCFFSDGTFVFLLHIRGIHSRSPPLITNV